MKGTSVKATTASIALGIVGLATLLWGQTTPTQKTPTNIVILAGPTDNAVDRLEASFGKVVSYEDPVWVWRGDLAPERFNHRPHRLEPVTPTFVMPALASPPADLATEVGKMLAAYHQTGGPRFEVRTSKLGLHIVPALSRDENGQMVAAKNVLDAYVSVPAEQRRAYQHFYALCDAIGLATGITITHGPAFPQGWDYEFNPDKTAFSWGASGLTGREALIDLLDRSATSFTWRLFCWTGQDAVHDHACLLDAHEVEVSITDANGKLKKTALLFDRCGKCPGLLPGLKPQLPPNQ